MLILTNMIVWCLVLDERLDLWPLQYLAEKVFPLKLHSQSLMSSLLPWTTNLHAPVSIYLSLKDLMSLDIAYCLILISGPFIATPTISLTYHLFWKLKKRKKKKKISIKLKNIIYTTQWHQYTPPLILKKNIYKTIQLENCAIKQRKIKIKFKENQKITWNLERKSLN